MNKGTLNGVYLTQRVINDSHILIQGLSFCKLLLKMCEGVEKVLMMRCSIHNSINLGYMNVLDIKYIQFFNQAVQYFLLIYKEPHNISRVLASNCNAELSGYILNIISPVFEQFISSFSKELVFLQ